VLDKVGVKEGSNRDRARRRHGPVLDKTPDSSRASVWKAIEDTTLIAYEMNGAPLPHLRRPGAHHRAGWTMPTG
jgi:DMSO/TMAO reductase YedYZ molybdopterin-dependent catalytic subunit